MEAGRERYCDDYRLPPLSLGLSSVRLIVNQFEAEYARAANKIQETGTEIVKYDPNVDDYHDHDDSLLDHSRGRVWRRIAMNLGIALCKCVPSVSFGNFGVLAVTTGLIAPRMISYLVLYPFCRLLFGTLYPAYASYKAVRTKNLKEYVKWMMYWIVFALFTCTETFTDVFLSWFPFYYEVKIVLVLWLLSPATKGSSILYRKFVHPALCRREQEIDEYIAKAKDQGYHTVLNLGTKGVNYATTVIMQTAIKGGGGLVQQLRKSYSLSDLTECEPRDERGADEADDVLAEPRLVRRPHKSAPRRSASESNSRSPMYFPEVDVDVRTNRPGRADEPDFSHIKSSEDISSGYSSADNSASLSRAGSLGPRARAARVAVTAIKRPQAAEDDEVIIEEPHDDDTFEYANMPPLVNIPSPIFLSHSDPPFLYQYIGDQIKIIQVLGDLPLSLNSNKKTTDSDQWDQINAAPETTQRESIEKENIKLDNVQKETKQDIEIVEATVLQTENIKRDKSISNAAKIIVPEDLVTETQKELKTQDVEKIVEDVVLETETQNRNKTRDDENTLDDTKTSEIGSEINKDCSDEKNKLQTVNKVEESLETTSLETSMNENYSAESDDEASFGTPDNSPKSKRKANKGKYGKAKAPPPPPKIEQHIVQIEQNDKILDRAISTTSQESLTDIVNNLPDNALKESAMTKGLQVVNPIAEKKRRHKAKSPARIPKAQNSSIGKLLQLPSKLAFWQKSDDKGKTDAISTSSGDHSRRSSTVERTANDEFQSCYELNKIINMVDCIEDDQMSFKDAADFDSEAVSQDIIEKSDALQKLIEAKLESHPEYKFVPLHEEIPTTSKSTDV